MVEKLEVMMRKKKKERLMRETVTEGQIDGKEQIWKRNKLKKRD